MGDVKEIHHRRVARAGSPAFDLASISNTVGAQSLAFFARAGTGDASANGSGLPRTADRVNSERTLAWHDKQKSIGRIGTRPCKNARRAHPPSGAVNEKLRLGRPS